MNIAVLAREHNNANVIAVGASSALEGRCHPLCFDLFGNAFSEDERHKRRIAVMDAY